MWWIQRNPGEGVSTKTNIELANVWLGNQMQLHRTRTCSITSPSLTAWRIQTMQWPTEITWVWPEAGDIDQVWLASITRRLQTCKQSNPTIQCFSLFSKAPSQPSTSSMHHHCIWADKTSGLFYIGKSIKSHICMFGCMKEPAGQNSVSPLPPNTRSCVTRQC